MPGMKKRRDGYRPYIGGPYKNRLNLTEAEFQVLIELFNQHMDQGYERVHRRKDHTVYTLEVKPFLRKLLKIGLRCGWTKVPACYSGPELH